MKLTETLQEAAEREASEKGKLKHVDEWLNEQSYVVDEKTDYAFLFLSYARLPAMVQIKVQPFMSRFKLFCMFQGKKYRVTGASRLGDVWLNEDHSKESGYTKRVSITGCSEWSDK